MPRFTDHEIAILIALYAAQKPLTFIQLSEACSVPLKTVIRIADGLKGCFERRLLISHHGKANFLGLSARGLIYAEMLTGGAQELEGAAE
jgi:hypothetical protein